MQTTVALIASVIRSPNQHDAEGLAHLYAPDATMEASDGAVYTGKAAIAAHVAATFAAFPRPAGDPPPATWALSWSAWPPGAPRPKR